MLMVKVSKGKTDPSMRDLPFAWLVTENARGGDGHMLAAEIKTRNAMACLRLRLRLTVGVDCHLLQAKLHAAVPEALDRHLHPLIACHAAPTKRTACGALMDVTVGRTSRINRNGFR